MIKFEAGKRYIAKLNGKSLEEVEIIKRTAKKATTKYWGKEKTVVIREKPNETGEPCEYLSILWNGVFASDIV